MSQMIFQVRLPRIFASLLVGGTLSVSGAAFGAVLGIVTSVGIGGGERQLTLLARAIAQQTPVLVLDEPVSNLDFGNQARVISHVCNLVKNLNRTIIMTTHFPGHGFLKNANVFLLHRNGEHCVGKGQSIITEEAVRELYHI